MRRAVTTQEVIMSDCLEKMSTKQNRQVTTDSMVPPLVKKTENQELARIQKKL